MGEMLHTAISKFTVLYEDMLALLLGPTIREKPWFWSRNKAIGYPSLIPRSCGNEAIGYPSLIPRPCGNEAIGYPSLTPRSCGNEAIAILASLPGRME